MIDPLQVQLVAGIEVGTRAETIGLHHVLGIFSPVVASSIADVVLESIVGPKPVSRRTEPVPVKHRGAATTRSALVAIADEACVVKPVGGLYVSRLSLIHI